MGLREDLCPFPQPQFDTREVPVTMETSKPILFDGGPSEPRTLEEVVGQAVGAGSVCWEHMDGTGVFQARRAKQIVEEAVGWIRTNAFPPS